jgi:hypothetical protein
MKCTMCPHHVPTILWEVLTVHFMHPTLPSFATARYDSGLPTFSPIPRPTTMPRTNPREHARRTRTLRRREITRKLVIVAEIKAADAKSEVPKS